MKEYKELANRSFEISEFEVVQKMFEVDGKYLRIDNNIDGILRLASYSKPFLSKKLNAAGFVRVLVCELVDGMVNIVGQIGFEE